MWTISSCIYPHREIPGERLTSGCQAQHGSIGCATVHRHQVFQCARWTLEDREHGLAEEGRRQEAMMVGKNVGINVALKFVQGHM